MIRLFSFLLILSLALATGCKSDATTDTSAAKNNIKNEIAKVDDTPTPASIAEKSPIETTEDIADSQPAEAPVAAKPAKPKPAPKPQAVKKPVAPKPAVKVEPKKPAPAPVPTAPKAAARVHFWETVHEFGEIDEGDKITAKFKFTNTGKAPLTIDDVAVSCGCTMPTYPIIPIGPGENGVIGVVYDSKGKFGTQKPTLTVKTNAVQPITKLYLSGSIKHVFEKVRKDTTAVKSDSTTIKG